MGEARGLEARRRAILERIARAAEDAGRDPADVTLIAVAKGQPIDALRAAYDAGQRHFGESRLQEALPKIAGMPDDVVWHFVGRLQSNKARKIAESFAVVHTLDNERQLAEIARAAGNPVLALIEVNVADEPQKAGISPRVLDRFQEVVANCEQVRWSGLMTVGPAVGDSEAMRPHFRLMREWAARMPGCRWLSMGMSQDYEVAIQEGATHVRIGTALFGPRT